MKILFLASEMAPFSKSGGLADVCEALPRALADAGHEVCVVTPWYRGVKEHVASTRAEKLTLHFPVGHVTTVFRLHRLTSQLQVVFIDIPEFFQREGLYGDVQGEYPDNAQRMGIFSLASLSAAQWLDFHPDIVHLNDWQTGLAALALKTGFAKEVLGQAKSVFTLHNLAYQGVFPQSVLGDLGIPRKFFHQEGLEYYGQVSFLKAGVAFADALTTVSPTYAKEILTPEGGHGLDGFLRSKASKLTGILNGIDESQWNPQTDVHVPEKFSAENLSGKKTCKALVLSSMGLSTERLNRPLFAMVSRLVEQKGVALVLEILPKLMDADVSVVVLGKGDALLETALSQCAAQHPKKLAVKLGFDVPLSHLVEAGADFFLMPSLFEPCGLNQMYSLRYGTLPLVRSVGGLEDSVVDLSLPDATGIKFADFHAQALWHAVERALQLYEVPSELAKIQHRGMTQDFSWKKSAKKYEEVYQAVRNSERAS